MADERTKKEALRLIMEIADRHGIAYVFFDSKDEADEFLAAMRIGLEVMRRCEHLGVEPPQTSIQ